MVRRRSAERSRGAVLIEMAIMAPFLLMLCFGIAEFGFQLVAANRMAGAVATAARVGSTSGRAPASDVSVPDRNILLSLRASLPDGLLDNVERVVVYRSDASGGFNASCLTISTNSGISSGANPCNVYSGATLRAVTTSTILTATSFYNTTTRNDRLSGPPDYIGVLVVSRSAALTDTFWGDFRVQRSSVFRISPDIDG